MKVLPILFLFLISFLGVAHAEQVYGMKYVGNVVKHQRNPSQMFDPIEISAISNDRLTFSGDAALNWDNLFSYDTGYCCSVHLGNQGSFTVRFDRPVNSVGLDIFPLDLDTIAAFESLGSSTVSAVYRNSEGEILGESSVTANWLGDFYDYDWQWNNSFNEHKGAFGVTTVDGFSEITFTVDGGESSFIAKGYSFVGPLSLASTELYYTYANPIPEPETYAMMLAGLGMLGFTAKHRKKHSA